MHTLQILHLFPTLGGGAFFALLRLVLYMQTDSGIDRSMVFVQGIFRLPLFCARVRR
jgi:hypothetical protein